MNEGLTEVRAVRPDLDIFCLTCGSAPDLNARATVHHPPGSTIFYRFPCSNRPECLSSIDLTRKGLSRLGKVLATSEGGRYMVRLIGIKEDLERIVEAAPEYREQIAALKELRALTTQVLEIGGMIERKGAVVIAGGDAEVRVLPGSLIERKLRERVAARIDTTMKAIAEKEPDARVRVPDLVEDEDAPGIS